MLSKKFCYSDKQNLHRIDIYKINQLIAWKQIFNDEK